MSKIRVFAASSSALLIATALFSGACGSSGSSGSGGGDAVDGAGSGAGPSTGAGGGAGICSENNCASSGGSTTPGAGGMQARGGEGGAGGGVAGATGCPDCNAGKVFLREGWAIQASSKTNGMTGADLSMPGAATTGWYATTVPATVFAALVANGAYPDPFIGDNLSQAPASIADGSWWYRTEFTPDASFDGKAIFLALDGINYRANVWLNGTQIAKSTEVVGTFTNYEWNVSSAVRAGAPNVLAIEIFPPDLKNDLALTWLDWNPGPPDRNMGIWQDVYLRKSDAVSVRGTHASSQVDPSLASAALTIKADVTNTSTMPVHATITAKIEQISLNQDVDLAAGEKKTITFDPKANPSLTLESPRLWWPAQLGSPELYQASVSASVGGAVSDSETIQFGIRDVSSSLTPQGYRLFKINGKQILIRGGGWASDMLLRRDKERLDAQFQYVRDLGLNAIRLEGKLEFDEFFEDADKYGILVIPGWMCCDRWQNWDQWNDQDHAIATASVTTQARRLRNHPSVIDFLIGSDEAPPGDVESEFLAAFQAADWPNPLGSSAADRSTPTLGKSGLKMPGPYDWVAPSYWMLDTTGGGAFGFNSESGPGPAIPEIETLQTVLTQAQQDSLWQNLSSDQYHAGTPGDQFAQLSIFNAALSARHGAPKSLADYVQKAQLMNYEGERAPYEAYSRNQYKTATGFIHWMLNNAWPSLIWHLYGDDLAPAGSYYGAKKGNEPLHILYSYDDKSIVVVNHTQTAETGLKATIGVYNLDASQKYSSTAMVDVPANGTAKAGALPTITGLSGTYFVVLTLERGDTVVSNNFYWLSSKAEKINFDGYQWYYTPTSTFADYSALATLGPATITAALGAPQINGASATAQLTLKNTGSALAFFTRAELLAGKGGKPVLPVIWQDNYVSLLPGETRALTVRYAVSDLGGAVPVVRVSGWNVAAQTVGG